MQVTVSKVPDGTRVITKDGHGELFSGDVKVGDPATSVGAGDANVALSDGPEDAAGNPTVLVTFSSVDYMDTATPGVPLTDGVRQTWARTAPGTWDFEPYQVSVSADVVAPAPAPEPVPVPGPAPA